MYLEGIWAVKNQWNGMVKWNTAMEYWNDLNITDT